MDEDTIITLIGIRMAKPGTEFIFRKKSSDCNGCKIKNTCLNLEEGGRYRIVSVRDAPSLECLIHEGGVMAVEVIETPRSVLIESRKALEGSTIVYEPVKCNEDECEMMELCQNPGITPGNKYTILKIENEPEEECRMGYSLRIVEIK